VLLRWLLSESAATQLTRDEVLALIAAANDSQQFACVWELNSLAAVANVPLSPPVASIVLIAAAHTQHYEQGVRIWCELDKDFADKAVREDPALLEAAVTCLHKGGNCQAACLLYKRSLDRPPSVGCSSVAIEACVQLAEWDRALDIFHSLPEEHKIACNVQAVAQATHSIGGHAAVCELFFQHFSQRWEALSEMAQCIFATALNDQHHDKEVTALLAHLQSKSGGSPETMCWCIPIWVLRRQFRFVIDGYFIIKRASLSISTQVFSCVIKACAEEVVDYSTFAAILKNARLANQEMSACDWDNAMTAASHNASAAELYSLVCEAAASGHMLSAASTTALLLATHQSAGAAEVVKLLKVLPMPLPKECIAAAATSLVHESLWNDALAVLECSIHPLSLTRPKFHDFQIIERCSNMFKQHGLPTDASFTKAAVRCRCIDCISAGDSSSAAKIIIPALRSRLTDAQTCVEVILALHGEAESIESSNFRGKPGTSASGVVWQQQQKAKAAEKAAALRQQAVQIFELSRQLFQVDLLGKAADCIISCLHRQQQPQALIDTLDLYLNTGQKLCDSAYAAAVLANENLGMHERALALLDEIQNRKGHLSALRAGSRCEY
jgi:hypothetical protein